MAISKDKMGMVPVDEYNLDVPQKTPSTTSLAVEQSMIGLGERAIAQGSAPLSPYEAPTPEPAPPVYGEQGGDLTANRNQWNKTRTASADAVEADFMSQMTPQERRAYNEQTYGGGRRNAAVPTQRVAAATPAPAAPTASAAIASAAMGASEASAARTAAPSFQQTPTETPQQKSARIQFQNQQARADYEQFQRKAGNAGQAAYQSAFRDAVKSGMPPSEARQIAVDAAKNANQRSGVDQFLSPINVPSSNPMMPNIVDNNGQPITDVSGLSDVDMYGNKVSFDRNGNIRPTSGGAFGNANIVTTPNGPMLRGAAGTNVPFVQDPVTGYTLPVSSESSAEDFARNLDPKVRAQTLEVLADGNDPVAQEFQRIDMNMQRVDVDPRLSPRQKQAAKDQLRQQQDGLLWSSMRDPSRLMSGRARTAAQNEATARREQSQSQALREREAAATQRRNAQIFERSYKQAESELNTDPFNAATPEQINARAMQLYVASGGGRPQGASQSAPGVSAGVAGAPGSTPTAGARTAPQSGAPDSTVAIDPQSPIDFEMVAPGQMVSYMPDGTPMRAMNFNGRAVAVPANQAEVDMLPPGALYVLEGQVRRGELKSPLRKEGDTGKSSTAANESPVEEQFRIGESATKIAGERNKSFSDYREQVAIYNEIDGESRRRAAQALGLTPEQLVFQTNAQGQKEWTIPETPDIKTQALSKNMDYRGLWEDALQKARVQVASERFAGSTKPMPDWIVRGQGGGGIALVDQPKPPAGYDPNRDYTKPGEEDVTEAERQYYGSRGTTKEQVMQERLLQEARQATGSIQIDNTGRATVNVNGRRYPAMTVKVGETSARLPAAMMRQGQTPEAVAKDALALLTSGKPFATVDKSGRTIPFKFDQNHPMLKVMREYRDKMGGDISAQSGVGQRNPGAMAAFAYVNEVFGYLPTQSRKFILDNLLTNKRLGNNFGGYAFTG